MREPKSDVASCIERHTWSNKTSSLLMRTANCDRNDSITVQMCFPNESFLPSRATSARSRRIPHYAYATCPEVRIDLHLCPSAWKINMAHILRRLVVSCDWEWNQRRVRGRKGAEQAVPIANDGLELVCGFCPAESSATSAWQLTQCCCTVAVQDRKSCKATFLWKYSLVLVGPDDESDISEKRSTNAVHAVPLEIAHSRKNANRWPLPRDQILYDMMELRIGYVLIINDVIGLTCERNNGCDTCRASCLQIKFQDITRCRLAHVNK